MVLDFSSSSNDLSLSEAVVVEAYYTFDSLGGSVNQSRAPFGTIYLFGSKVDSLTINISRVSTNGQEGTEGEYIQFLSNIMLNIIQKRPSNTREVK